MICPKCNNENIAEAKFCIKCGSDLSAKTIPIEQVRKPQERLKYCVFCKRRIQYDAIKCPLCKKYNNYAEVPWYRRDWVGLLSFLLLPPAGLLLVITGDIYYERKGELKIYGRVIRVIMVAVGLQATVFLGGHIMKAFLGK